MLLYMKSKSAMEFLVQVDCIHNLHPKEKQCQPCKKDRQLRTALGTVLRGDWARGFLSHFGLKCASWTAINSGTSSRSPCSAIGNTDFPSVVCANLLTSRTFGMYSCHASKWPYFLTHINNHNLGDS